MNNILDMLFPTSCTAEEFNRGPPDFFQLRVIAVRQ
jgi:hypothetical protein